MITLGQEIFSNPDYHQIDLPSTSTLLALRKGFPSRAILSNLSHRQKKAENVQQKHLFCAKYKFGQTHFCLFSLPCILNIFPNYLKRLKDMF